SCDRPRKRSASEAPPSPVSNRYCLSIRTTAAPAAAAAPARRRAACAPSPPRAARGARRAIALVSPSCAPSSLGCPSFSAECAHRERPRHLALERVSPRCTQVGKDRGERIEAAFGPESLQGRPRAEIAVEVLERPCRAHLELGNGELRERKRDRAVAG